MIFPELTDIPVEPDCEGDSDCNVGLSGVCSTDPTGQTVDCKYCDGGQCMPGCRYNSSAPHLPRCPDGLPVCNSVTHNCQANSGSTLLNTIVFTSLDCVDCTREGVNMSLAGDDIVIPQPRCKAVNLDHEDRQDFSSTSTFRATTEEQHLGWENCWNVRLTEKILEESDKTDCRLH